MSIFTLTMSIRANQISTARQLRRAEKLEKKNAELRELQEKKSAAIHAANAAYRKLKDAKRENARLHEELSQY